MPILTVFVKLTCPLMLNKIRTNVPSKIYENDTTKERNILDKNDNKFEKLLIDPKFKYYQNHEFHKLKKKI